MRGEVSAPTSPRASIQRRSAAPLSFPGTVMLIFLCRGAGDEDIIGDHVLPRKSFARHSPQATRRQLRVE
eukprot:153235-Pyramimonas_sp.AAC.1